MVLVILTVLTEKVTALHFDALKYNELSLILFSSFNGSVYSKQSFYNENSEIFIKCFILTMNIIK